MSLITEHKEMPLIWLMSRPDTVPSRGKAFSRKLRVALVAAGLTEAKSCSLVESGVCALLHVEPAVPDINIFSARNPLLDLQCAVLGSDVGTFTASIRQVALFTEVVKCTPADKYRVRAESPFQIQSASSMLRLGGHVLSEDSVQTLRHCRCRYDSGVFDVSEVVEMWGYHELPRMAVTTISSIGQAICARRVTSIVLHRSWTALRGLFGNWPGPPARLPDYDENVSDASMVNSDALAGNIRGVTDLIRELVQKGCGEETRCVSAIFLLDGVADALTPGQSTTCRPRGFAAAEDAVRLIKCVMLANRLKNNKQLKRVLQMAIQVGVPILFQPALLAKLDEDCVVPSPATIHSFGPV